jgi:hypothetical protein
MIVLCSAPAAGTTLGARVDNGDGTYYRALPTSASTAPFWRGPLHFVYDGQQDFAWTPKDWDSVTLNDDPVQAPDDGGIHGLIGSVSVDELGRRWVVDAVDLPALNAKIDAYNIDIGGENTTPMGQAPPQDADGPGDVDWEPMSWKSEKCAGGEKDAFWYDHDLSTQHSTHDSVRDTVGVVYAWTKAFGGTKPDEYSLQPVCSGFFVDSSTFVSAAHCFFDDELKVRSFESEQIVVCTRGNHAAGAACSNVGPFFVNQPEFVDGPNKTIRISWDIAVLKLLSPIGDGRRLRMSRAGKDTVATEPSIVIGHPGYWNYPTCQENIFPDRQQQYAPGGQYLLTSTRYIREQKSDMIRGSRNSVLRTRLTGGKGQSGGPMIYHCQITEVCTGSPFAIAVAAGKFSRGTKQFTGGPFMRDRRSWVLGYME